MNPSTKPTTLCGHCEQRVEVERLMRELNDARAVLTTCHQALYATRCVLDHIDRYSGGKVDREQSGVLIAHMTEAIEGIAALNSGTLAPVAVPTFKEFAKKLGVPPVTVLAVPTPDSAQAAYAECARIVRDMHEFEKCDGLARCLLCACGLAINGAASRAVTKEKP